MKSTFRKKILLVVLWVCIWPIIVLVVGVALAVLFGGFMELSQSSEFQIYLGGFFASIVILCTAAYALLIRSKNHVFKTGGVILGGYTFCGVMMIILVFSYMIGYMNDEQVDSKNGQVANSFVIPNLPRDENIDSTLRAIGAQENEILKFSTTYVETFDTALVDDQLGLYIHYINPTDGTFLYGEMSIKKGQEPDVERTMIAHEYLHHIWHSTIDADTKSRLESDLISTYGNDPAIRDRTISYTKAQNLQATELFSYYCTESSDGYLSGFVLEQCNKYINRASLQLLR